MIKAKRLRKRADGLALEPGTAGREGRLHLIAARQAPHLEKCVVEIRTATPHGWARDPAAGRA